MDLGKKSELQKRRKFLWNTPDQSGASKESTSIPWPEGRYAVHNNVYMSILPTDVCNAHCGFCSSLVLTRERRPDLKYSVGEYAERIKNSLDILIAHSIAPPVSISGGGEPTLSPRLPYVMEALKCYVLPKIILHTNGTRLFHKVHGANGPGVESSTILDCVLQAGCNHLNLSIAHWDMERNSEIMQLRSKLTVVDVSKTVSLAKQNGCRVRLSLVLLKEGVQTVSQLKEYLSWALSLGIDDVIVRELASIETVQINANETTRYINQQRVQFLPILEALDHDSDFRHVSLKSGQTHYRENFRFRNAMDVGFLVYRFVSESEESEKVKFIVIHPNGSVNASWNKTRRVLISTHRQAAPVH